MEYAYLFWALGAGFVVMLTSLAGVILTAKSFKDKIAKEIDLFSSLSAGVFLIVGVSLLIEIVEHIEVRAIGLTAALLGALAMVILARIPEFHHHHGEDEHGGGHSHSRGAVRRILISDAFHTVGDGLLIGAAFATDAILGIVATIGIVVHELLQEISEYFVLRQSGLTALQALKLNFLISSTVLLGITASVFLVESERVEAVILGVSAGTVLTVVFHDLLPNSKRLAKSNGGVKKHIAAFTLGSLAMVLLSLLIGH